MTEQSNLARLLAWQLAGFRRWFTLTPRELHMQEPGWHVHIYASPACKEASVSSGESRPHPLFCVTLGTDDEPATLDEMVAAGLEKWEGVTA